ncbi:hypothetical protein CLOM_g19404, partial [Closterium sp. NIES-68]
LRRRYEVRDSTANVAPRRRVRACSLSRGEKKIRSTAPGAMKTLRGEKTRRLDAPWKLERSRNAAATHSAASLPPQLTAVPLAAAKPPAGMAGAAESAESGLG